MPPTRSMLQIKHSAFDQFVRKSFRTVTQLPEFRGKPKCVEVHARSLGDRCLLSNEVGKIMHLKVDGRVGHITVHTLREHEEATNS